VILIPFGRRPRAVVGTSLAALALLALPACSASGASRGAAVSVVASFYPLAEAAQEVGGRFVTVTNLTAPGVEPHDIELTPRQIGAIATADLVLYLGGGFQPAVEDALGDASGPTLDAGAGLRARPVPAGETEAGLTADPHVWLDPVLYRQIVDRIDRALSRVDPRHASSFAENARVFDDRLGALDASYRSGLADCPRNLIVTSHAAFGYLAARYGVVQQAVSGLSPDAEPTPQRLADLKTLVERDGVTTIFTEELISPKVADTLASETGATTAVLSPLESLTPSEAAAGDDYVSVMRSNLHELEDALGCR
jgi:zinc transport system substrate-binding protein